MSTFQAMDMLLLVLLAQVLRITNEWLGLNGPLDSCLPKPFSCSFGVQGASGPPRIHFLVLQNVLQSGPQSGQSGPQSPDGSGDLYVV